MCFILHKSVQERYPWVKKWNTNITKDSGCVTNKIMLYDQSLPNELTGLMNKKQIELSSQEELVMTKKSAI